MRVYILIIFFAIFFSCLHSQNTHDSLVAVAAKSPDNLQKLILYNAIEASAKKKEDILKLSEKTAELADKLLKMFPQKKDSILHFKGIALNDIGYYYKEFGKTGKAVEYTLESIKIQDQIRDSSELITSYNNLAIMLREQGDTTGALNYLFKAENLADKYKKPFLLAHVQSQIGQSYKQRGNYAMAMQYYEKSLKIAREQKNEKQIARLLNFMGNVSLKQNKVDEAISKFEESLKIFEEKKDLDGQSSSLLYLAAAYFHAKNDLSKAEKYYLKSYELAKQKSNLFNKQHCMQALGMLYNKLGKYKLAYEYHFNYIQLRDSLQNEETKRSVLKKELQYSFDKKASADSVKNAEERKVQEAVIRANESQLKQEKNFRYTLYGGITLLLVFGGITYNRFKLTQKQKHIIEQKSKETETQKVIIEEKQKEILDSIHYAKRIQHALLASNSLLNNNLNGPENYFVYFKPKDIVSGDFYWATEQDNYFYLAVCDSTGHGVPGAFMSLLNIGFMSEAIKEHNILSPDQVFTYVRQRLVNSISQEGQKDGFDGILLRLDKNNGSLTYAAAHNRPFMVNENNFKELECDKMPVGKGEKDEPFRMFTIEKQNGWLYLYTDGYADQFGGPKGKKFKYKSLNELLSEASQKSSSEQKNIIDSNFENWKGSLEQVDDVLVIGIKIT